MKTNNNGKFVRKPSEARCARRGMPYRTLSLTTVLIVVVWRSFPPLVLFFFRVFLSLSLSYSLPPSLASSLFWTARSLRLPSSFLIVFLSFILLLIFLPPFLTWKHFKFPLLRIFIFLRLYFLPQSWRLLIFPLLNSYYEPLSFFFYFSLFWWVISGLILWRSP